MRTATAVYALPKPTRRISIIASVLLAAMAMVLVAPAARADRFDEQIAALNRVNGQTRASQQTLAAQEASLAAIVADLRAKVAALHAQIATNQALRDQLQRQITDTEAEIVRQRSILSQNIKTMYLENRISTLEMLASSKDLSQFVDRQQYREMVSDKLKTTLDRITELKKQLETKKAGVEKLLVDQQLMQQQLDAQHAEADRLLGLNHQQQAAYEQSVRTNNAKIANLRRQQAIENARYFKGGWKLGGTGGYPWAGVPYPSSSADPWGMYKRECVSYAAWRVAASGRHMPYWGGRGNAKQWDDNARAMGIPVDTKPRAGDVAVSNAGTYGHVMYVEAVNADGSITISQYNAGWDGRYSIGTRSTMGLAFIHF